MALKHIKAYWWNRHPNLGDVLTPLLLQHFGFSAARTDPGDADVCVVGSVLELIGPHFPGAVIGAGFVADGGLMPMPRARVLAVRGPLSAARVGLPDVVLGDAGLLCPLLLPGAPRTQVRLGIVPHFKDKEAEAVRELAARWPREIRIIDVQDEPLRVLTAIAECEAVLSSSLHGLITAEAFGRRSGWLVLSDAVIGGGYKFRDHYGAFGCEAAPHTLHGRETIDQLDRMATPKPIDLPSVLEQLAGCFHRL
jgi:pyruvyltransferase